MPNATDSADFARIHYFTIDEYISNFELLRRFLDRDNVLNDFAKVDFRGSDALDKNFAQFLCDIRSLENTSFEMCKLCMAVSLSNIGPS